MLNECVPAFVQVADEYLAPDVLGTVKEMKAVNFRRVPKMPVYGMAQPTSEVQHLLIPSLTTITYTHTERMWNIFIYFNSALDNFCIPNRCFLPGHEYS